MENVTILKTYNLLNSKGNSLQLSLGVQPREKHTRDTGFRWSFTGTEIPMPVRSGTWFNGFPEQTMLDWLKGNGWYPRTCVNMHTGRAVVYELPKGNENYEIDAALTCALKLMWEKGHRLRAIRLYRHFNECTMDEAHVAVREIVDQQI